MLDVVFFRIAHQYYNCVFIVLELEENDFLFKLFLKIILFHKNKL